MQTEQHVRQIHCSTHPEVWPSALTSYIRERNKPVTDSLLLSFAYHHVQSLYQPDAVRENRVEKHSMSIPGVSFSQRTVIVFLSSSFIDPLHKNAFILRLFHEILEKDTTKSPGWMIVNFVLDNRSECSQLSLIFDKNDTDSRQCSRTWCVHLLAFYLFNKRKQTDFPWSITESIQTWRHLYRVVANATKHSGVGSPAYATLSNRQYRQFEWCFNSWSIWKSMNAD